MAQFAKDKFNFRPSRIQFVYFSLILAWAANTIFYFATTNPPLIVVRNHTTRLADFVGYYEAAKLGAAATGLYDFKTQLMAMNRIIAPVCSEIAWAIPYPPTFYLLVVPLGFLPLTAAYVFWKFISVPVGLLGTSILLFAQKRFSKIDCLAILLALISNTPALVAIRAGQFSFPQMALISLFCWGFLEGRSFAAGVCLGLLALIKPHYAIFLGIPVLITRRWKVLRCAFPLAVAVVLATGVRFGWNVFADYAHYLSEVYTSANYAGISPADQVNLRALIIYDLLHLPTGKTALVFGTLSFAGGLAASLWLWIKASRRPELFAWAMAVTLVLSVFCGPHVHVHDCLMLGVAAILTLPSVSPAKVFAESDKYYRLWCMTLLLYPLVSIVGFNLSIFNSSIMMYTAIAQNLILTITGIIFLMRRLNGLDTQAHQVSLLTGGDSSPAQEHPNDTGQ